MPNYFGVGQFPVEAGLRFGRVIVGAPANIEPIGLGGKEFEHLVARNEVGENSQRRRLWIHLAMVSACWLRAPGVVKSWSVLRWASDGNTLASIMRGLAQVHCETVGFGERQIPPRLCIRSPLQRLGWAGRAIGIQCIVCWHAIKVVGIEGCFAAIPTLRSRDV